jgi:hypothetical protein
VGPIAGLHTVDKCATISPAFTLQRCIERGFGGKRNIKKVNRHDLGVSNLNLDTKCNNPPTLHSEGIPFLDINTTLQTVKLQKNYISQPVYKKGPTADVYKR